MRKSQCDRLSRQRHAGLGWIWYGGAGMETLVVNLPLARSLLFHVTFMSATLIAQLTLLVPGVINFLGKFFGHIERDEMSQNPLARHYVVTETRFMDH